MLIDFARILKVENPQITWAARGAFRFWLGGQKRSLMGLTLG
jgi:hypothetical protein